MINALRDWLLRILRVPPEPSPPAGAPESVRIFRASRNFFRLKLLKWGLGQAGALVGLLAFLPAAHSFEFGPATIPIRLIESAGLVIYFLQLPFTYLMVRFDFEMRWYIVTDRSLRIRYGLQHVREMTMTFANVQQIKIEQGPLQRLLGIADLQVRTAGGGSDDSTSEGSRHGAGSHSMHLGYFRGVDNAEEIRDLMLARLRRWQDAGLGDPDDIQHHGAPAETPVTTEAGVLDAAQRVLVEARALRAAVGSL